MRCDLGMRWSWFLTSSPDHSDPGWPLRHSKQETPQRLEVLRERKEQARGITELVKSAGNSDFPVLCPLPGCASCQAIITALLWVSQESTAWIAEQGQLNNTDKTRVPGQHPEAPGPGLSIYTPLHLAPV